MGSSLSKLRTKDDSRKCVGESCVAGVFFLSKKGGSGLNLFQAFCGSKGMR